MFAWLMLACVEATAPPDAPPPPAPALALPSSPPGDLGPSRLEVSGDPAALADSARCAQCHPEQATQWQGSVHAHASLDNPWYAASVASVREAAGARPVRHCGGCHDPALLVAGTLEPLPAASSPEASAGVGCMACHGIRGGTVDGNASLTLVLDLAVPDPGEDPTSHVRDMAAGEAAASERCGACHRGFLGLDTGNGTHLDGMDDLGPWAASPWAGSEATVLWPEPIPARTCVDCHLGPDRDHGMTGGHTSLTAQTGLLEETRERLAQAAQLVLRRAPEPGAVDVVVVNTGTGHAFPGGIADVEALHVVLSVDGRPAGTLRLGAEMLDPSGQPEAAHRTHRFAISAWTRTVPPFGAQVLRFELDPMPVDGALTAELVHIKHAEQLADAACAATNPDTLDGCAQQPETVLATSAVRDDFHARFVHALGLSRGLQEDLEQALVVLPDPGDAPDARSAAAADWLAAVVHGRLGRVDAALTAADRAEARVGPHAALQRARGDALAQVWRWTDAVPHYELAAAAAPRDTESWRDLALARASALDPVGAIEAAATGLASAPRDPTLLRVQAVSAAAVDHPDAESARAAWLQHRRPDRTQALRDACDARDPDCASRRRPIPRVNARPAP